MTAIEEKCKQNNGVGVHPSPVRDSSSQNDSGTELKSGTPLTQARSASVPRRYRIVAKDGWRSPPFTPKPGQLGQALTAAFPGQDEYEIEIA